MLPLEGWTVSVFISLEYLLFIKVISPLIRLYVYKLETMWFYYGCHIGWYVFGTSVICMFLRILLFVVFSIHTAEATLDISGLELKPKSETST